MLTNTKLHVFWFKCWFCLTSLCNNCPHESHIESCLECLLRVFLFLIFFSFFFHINVSHFIAVAIIYGLEISIGEYVPALAFVIAVPAMGLILDMVIIIEDYIGSGSKADAAGNFGL